jgi:hypothetical protein
MRARRALERKPVKGEGSRRSAAGGVMAAPHAIAGSYLHETAPLLTGSAKAILSADRLYRYWLDRHWGSSGTHATWIMLNPSTADALEDDPTIRRCIAFTKAWGLDGLIVVNLFAFRSPDPQALMFATDPVGEANDDFIRQAVFPWSVVVAAWGAHKLAAQRAAQVMQIVQDQAGGAGCLGLTKGGGPRHPLYVRGRTDIADFGAVTAGAGAPARA